MGTHPGNRAAPESPSGRRLSNERYAVHLTDRGTGWSEFGQRLVTSGARYPEREGGVWAYVRDLDDGAVWPLALRPGTRRPDLWAVDLEGSPRFLRVDGDLATLLEVALAPDAAAEVRRITVVNRGDRPRRLDVTTAVPVALDHPDAYAGHPAFSKLFLETARVPEIGGVRARRRPRSPGDDAVSAVHLLLADDDAAGPPTFGTDRARFLGRGRGWGRPAALDPGGELDGSVGSVLDPVLALRRTLVLEPGASATLVAVLAAGPSPDEALRDARGVAAPDALSRILPARPALDLPDAAVGRGAAVLESVFHAGAAPPRAPERPEPTRVAVNGDRLRFFNGIGGFGEGGDEYVIRLGAGPNALNRPPLPWINVVANDRVGFLASESGAGYTWAGNSRLNRLTPWSNDPVTDPHGEAVYLREDESGAYWSPTPGPAPGPGEYEARHGFGYSRWRHNSHGLEQDTWQLVAEHDPVKLVLVRIANRSGRPRRLAAFAWVEWVLGGAGEARRTVRAAAEDGVVLARNPATEDFEGAVAFAAAVAGAGAAGRVRSSASQAAFLGAGGDPSAPAALADGADLPSSSGAGSAGDDACAAFQLPLELAADETAWCAFLLGQAGSEAEAREVIGRYPTPAAVEAELGRVREAWSGLLGRVVVETPSEALDVMLNGWLPYQDLACRLRGRSAFYQSGGAYGYRDQLQDATGLIYHDPTIARRQIVLHAAQQFPEGDVLHWWHPPAGRGIRTRFSDDLLWLPWVLGFYLDVTGDATVLDERASFVRGPALEPGEDERYILPERATVDASVYEHACLALDRSLTRGRHGLPLMGTGDWNDGMNRVGREGEGESVWLGFFLASILRRWIPLCRERGDEARAVRYAGYLDELERALEDAGWDGDWYRRAYYDSGAVIGSAESDECRIDAIAQAWAVISGVAAPDRAERALDALEAHLVDDDAGIIRLLTPPFDRTPHDPGYIKGYVPGVRENGGQYTHGVLWAVRALAEAGRTERAASLLEMLLPVCHARTPEGVERYRVEPYVVAADVYGAPPHVGRGGWTWYTGSAAWMYRVALESVLGFEVRDGSRLRLRPCIPAAWPGYRIDYRLPGSDTRYRIDVRRGGEATTTAVLDGEPVAVRGGVPEIVLADDGGSHQLDVALGDDAGRRYVSASSDAPADATTSA